jgi:ribosomal protein S18 acetylase RimI-like enzyme
MVEASSRADIVVRPFQVADEAEIVALWDRCGLLRPWNDPRKDIARKQSVGGELFLVASCGERVVGTVMAGYDGHRGWINYLAVEPELRRGGLGRRLVAEAERCLLAVRCPKVNLQVRAENVAVIAFYRKLGYVVDDVVSLGKRLVNDRPNTERSDVGLKR